MVAIALTGCGLGKMIKKYGEVKYTVDPPILEVHADKVPVKISATVPAKYFIKGASATFTPVLKWEGGEVSLKPITVLGETAQGDGQKIKNASGGSFSYTDTIPYKPAMKKSELFAKVGLAMKSKTADLPERKLTVGCITTSTRVANDEDIRLGADKYVKESIISQEAEIYYPIQSAVIPQKEMTGGSMKTLKEFVAKKYITKNITITAWASPDGPVELNDKLSGDRSTSAFKYVQNELVKMKLDGAKNEELYSKVSKGEYWDGFNKLVGASNIEDRQLILDIVNRHSDVNSREQEIKNLAVVYLTLAKDILPKLRKADIAINSQEPKKTDAQIDSLSLAKPDSLDVEELLYAATLSQDLDKQLKIYESASNVYPDDWRGYNNVGYIYLKQGKLDEAKSWLEKAKAKNATAEVLSNLGVAAAWSQDYEGAIKNFEEAKSGGGNVSNNLGILNLRTGNYTTALEYFGSDCSYNAALSNLLLKNNDAAKTKSECAAKTAATAYLQAIIGARMGDAGMMSSSLKAAVGQDANYRREAMDDLEFSKFWENTDFKGAIQ